MKLLVLESSGLVASVAIVSEEQVIAEYTIHYKKTHSQTLLSMLDSLVNMLELDLKEIDAIAVSSGPGSFTGLRIGSATAKGLGLALEKPLISVSTLKGLAYNLYHESRLICPIMDAKRNQVYTAFYQFIQTKLEPVTEEMICPIEEVVKMLNQKQREVIFVGDGVPVYESILKDKLIVPHSFAPAHLSRQRAAAVGMLAVMCYKEGNIQLAREHVPNYLRLSQAERERMEHVRKIEQV